MSRDEEKIKKELKQIYRKLCKDAWEMEVLDRNGVQINTVRQAYTEEIIEMLESTLHLPPRDKYHA